MPDPSVGVLHKCDTPACVNWDHLFLGTQLDNVLDAIKKQRPVPCYPGEGNPMHKLTSAQVIEMRRLKSELMVSNHDLAIQFNTTPRNVRWILSRKRWRHI